MFVRAAESVPEYREFVLSFSCYGSLCSREFVRQPEIVFRKRRGVMEEKQEHGVPEIFTKRVTRQLPSDELEARILAFLGSRSLCVLATCRSNVPRATPVLYRSKGFTIYMAGEPGRKLGNISQNPTVSIAIFDPEAEFSEKIDDITGLQIGGKARLIGKEEPEFMDAFLMFGRPASWAEHWYGKMIEVVPDRIELLAMGLKNEGYAARQIWVRNDR